MNVEKRDREKGQSNERRDNTEGRWMDGEGWRAGGMDRWVSLNSNLRI